MQVGEPTKEHVMNEGLRLMDETRDGVTVLHVMTERLIDPKLADRLTIKLNELIGDGSAPLAIDMGGVTHLTSIFFRSFIAAGKEAGKKKTTMVFCNVSGTIKQGFQIVGLDKLFKIFDSEQEALRFLGAKKGN
jgi:anti-anti-sigma factor